MNQQDLTRYIFYILLVAIAGGGEYFHLLPAGAMATILGGVLGHGAGMLSYAAANNTKPMQENKSQ